MVMKMRLIDLLIAHTKKYEESLNKLKEFEGEVSEEKYDEITEALSKAGSIGITLSLLTDYLTNCFFTDEQKKEAYRIGKEALNKSMKKR